MPDEALRLFAVHGAPPSANNHNLYRRLAADLFADPSPKTYKQWADLRELLLGYVCTCVQKQCWAFSEEKDGNLRAVQTHENVENNMLSSIQFSLSPCSCPRRVTTATSGSTKQEFDRLTRVAHYFALREAAKSVRNQAIHGGF